tara:strand:- start:1790 stop:2719 length:930 start_codon:yes stop_codon:yes gene_type:complete
MADLHKYKTHELLSKVLNAGEDALNVDIDNVTLTTEGGDVAIDVALDKANDSVTVYANTAADGSGTSTVPLVDAAGHVQVDIISSALPSGGATAANQSTIIGHVDGVETLLTGIDADTDAIKTDAAAIEVLLTAANVDHAANEALLTTIDADTGAIKTAVETIDNAISGTEMQVDVVAALPAGSNTIGVVDLGSTDNAVLDAIDAVLDTIKVDTEAVETATEASQAALEKMLYGTALAVTAVHGGSDHSLGATYEAFHIGVGGDISLDCATSGTNIVFKNLASGQMLPVRATVVNATNTTATNIVALKA